MAQKALKATAERVFEAAVAKGTDPPVRFVWGMHVCGVGASASARPHAHKYTHPLCLSVCVRVCVCMYVLSVQSPRRVTKPTPSIWHAPPECVRV